MKEIKMKFMVSLIILIVASMLITVKSTEAEVYGGVEFPEGAVSFADVVVS